MNCKKILASVGLSIVIFSCNTQSGPSAADTTVNKIRQESSQPPGEKIPLDKPGQPQLTDSATPTGKLATPAADWDKKIIKTATLKFEVKDFKSYSSSVYRTVKQFGGYIAGEDQTQSEGRDESTVTIKVPVAQFEDMLAQLSSKDVKVIERKINTDDVGDQLIDTKSRLEAKKAMHAKYLQFFKDAKNMEEVLKVQNDINNLHENMESAAGRINYLTQQAALSTIVLTFYQPLEGFKPEEDPSFLKRVGDAFTSGSSWLGSLLVGLISIWPLLLVVGAGVFFAKKFFAAKNKQSNV